jgi:dipicolinate synthase subunit A
MKTLKFAVIGGDRRNIFARDMLRAEGFDVCAFALGSEDEPSCLASALADSDYILAPTPFTKDGVMLNTPLYSETIFIEDFLRLIAPQQKLFAGGINRAARELCNQYQTNATDLLSIKELTILNAIPTAEGAVKIAVESSPITLHGSNTLILGFGKIGKSLAKLLTAFGADITATSRRNETDSETAQYAISSVRIDDSLESLRYILGSFDFIFNTVPHVLIDAELCERINKNAVYIELASSPYGIDKLAAGESGITVIDAPSLPGKTAPKTAAGYIVKTVRNIIREGEGHGV